jgi:hypothetical protein
MEGRTVSLYSLNDECPTCFGIIMDGLPETMRARGERLGLRCKCEIERERADLEPKELPNGRWSVAA